MVVVDDPRRTTIADSPVRPGAYCFGCRFTRPAERYQGLRPRLLKSWTLLLLYSHTTFTATLSATRFRSFEQVNFFADKLFMVDFSA